MFDALLQHRYDKTVCVDLLADSHKRLEFVQTAIASRITLFLSFALAPSSLLSRITLISHNNPLEPMLAQDDDERMYIPLI